MEQSVIIGREAVAAKRKQYFYPCTAHFYRDAPQLVRGSMQYVYDENGKEYTDFSRESPWLPAATVIRLLLPVR